MYRPALAALLMIVIAGPAWAQQRPLVTEDPETVDAGHLLIEGGAELRFEQKYPVSGLQGDLWRLPTLGLSIGLSSIAELQIDGGIYDRLSISKRTKAPLSSLVTATGDHTHDVSDLVIGTKIKMVSEAPGHPAVGIRFATKLPNASNESGLGLDTTDFFASLLVAKNVQSLRVVGNVGLGILADPTSGNRQNDVLTYGISLAQALTPRAELVGEINGRASMRSGTAFPGTDSSSMVRGGLRFTPGSVRFDGGVMFGLTDDGPDIGFTAGLTYVFNAFHLPNTP